MNFHNDLDCIVYDWGVRCFGREHMNDVPTRTLRMVEEAIEAAQAVGITAEMLHRQIDQVYARTRGDMLQELGGVIVTSRLLCNIVGLSPEEIYLAEMRRCLGKDPQHFAQRNEKKMTVVTESKPRGLMFENRAIIPSSILIDCGRPYKGVIRPGMVFAWEPDLPYARELIVVTKMETNEDKITFIWSRSLGDQNCLAVNDESIFRDAVVPTILRDQKP